MVGDRPYLLTAIWPKGKKESIGTFVLFDSFRLASAAARKWVDVSLPGGSCWVKMPATPTENSHSYSGKHGRYVERLFVSSTEAGTYVAWRSDYAAGSH